MGDGGVGVRGNPLFGGLAVCVLGPGQGQWDLTLAMTLAITDDNPRVLLNLAIKLHWVRSGNYTAFQ